MQRKKIVIVGGGFSGMVTAYFASKFFKKNEIILLENSNSLGGLYNSVNFKNKFFFDHGMHIFYQSKNKIINNFFFKILKKSQWNILRGVKKDIAGLFYQKKLHTKSPYIDLTNIDTNKKKFFIKEIISYKKKKLKKNYGSLENYFLKKFGKTLTYKIINPVVKKFWGHESKKIDAVAANLILIDRINLFKKNIMDSLIASKFYRSRFGYPDQLLLPKKYQSSQTYGLYPKKFGMFNVIRKLVKILKKAKISIYLNYSINNFFIKNKKIDQINISNEKQNVTIKNVYKIFWTVSIFGLINILKLKFKKLKLDKNKKQIFVYFLCKEKPQMGGNYYFMCFDKNFFTFRVTSYYEYCRNAKKINSYYPLCMELHFESEIKKLDYKKIALKELFKFKIIKNINSIKHVFVKEASGFFPVMTLKNTAALSQIKKKINKRNLKNLFFASQSPENKIFFMHDVLDQNINLLYKLKNDEIKN